jgi:hypothetical protein
MKKILLPILLLSFSFCQSQQKVDAEKKAITEKVNLFFKVLETKDTALYKTLVYSDAQIWTIRPIQDTLKIASRSFSTDITNLAAMKTTIEERPMSFDIKVHNNIAIVWAPYTLSISGKFSHCGVDVFTLLKSVEGWKIVSTVYSVEPNGCASLQKQ